MQSEDTPTHMVELETSNLNLAREGCVRLWVLAVPTCLPPAQPVQQNSLLYMVPPVFSYPKGNWPWKSLSWAASSQGPEKLPPAVETAVRRMEASGNSIHMFHPCPACCCHHQSTLPSCCSHQCRNTAWTGILPAAQQLSHSSELGHITIIYHMAAYNGARRV